MKYYLLSLLLCCVSHAAAGNQTSQQDYIQLLEKVDDLWRGNSSKGVMEMHVKTKHYERTMKMEFYSKGEEKTFIKIIEPKKEKGTATLKLKDEVYNYLPKINRTVKVGAAMMGGSWMGSHFTNDDLVKSSRLSEDYKIKLKSKKKHKGKALLTLALMPKENAAVVWGKIEIEILMPDLLPNEERFYDEDMKLVRTMTFSEVKNLGGRTLPTKMRIAPEDKDGEFTEMTYEKLDFNVSLPKSLFSLSQFNRF